MNGKLERAAVLLLYRVPWRLFAGCCANTAQFGADSYLRQQDAMEGSLILRAERLVEFVFFKYLEIAISCDKEVRVKSYPYAREAVRQQDIVFHGMTPLRST